MSTNATKRQIARDRFNLQNPYAHLNGEGGFEALACNAIKPPIRVRRQEIFEGRRGNRRLPDRVVIEAARNLQRKMWLQKDSLYPDHQVPDPVQVLDPTQALLGLGLDCDLQESLGQYSDRSGTFEVAGLIDSSSYKVSISRQFSPEVRRFTAAHELGHAILHPDMTLHRDRGLDGANTHNKKDWREREADIFATEYLMPERLVRQRFEQIFGTNPFTITDDTAFALASVNQDELRKRLPTLRKLSRVLATTGSYGGKHFTALTGQFRVSPEAMAIRLEELGFLQS